MEFVAAPGVLEKHSHAYPAAHVAIIPWHPVNSRTHLVAFLQTLERPGGEGVIVCNPATPYAAGRSRQMLECKRMLDDECTILTHHAGEEKHRGRPGALSCWNAHGVFRTGTGFSDADRENPLPIGSLITYRHQGFTKNRIPRFALFWRGQAEVVGVVDVASAPDTPKYPEKQGR